MVCPFPKSDFVTVNGVRLHYLDWGDAGDGTRDERPVLLFLAGMGCTAYIFQRFALHFTDRFHVMALTRRGHGDSEYPETGYDVDSLTEDLRQFLDRREIDRVTLAGHSMAYLELSRFAALYPDRVNKLVFIDAAFDNTDAEYQAVLAKNPIPAMIPAWPERIESIEEYTATVQRLYPALAAIWGEVMDEEIRHTLYTTEDGSVMDKMSEEIVKAIRATFASYLPAYASIQAPMLCLFCIQNGAYYLSPNYMTEDQQTEVLEYFKIYRVPYTIQYIDRFRRTVPQAIVVTIPGGHHYCFLKQEDVVCREMQAFLS